VRPILNPAKQAILRTNVDRAADNILLAFSFALIALAWWHGDASIEAGIVSCSIVVGASILIPFLRDRTQSRTLYILYILYIMPSLFLVYPTAIALAKGLHSQDFDPKLIAIDRFLFGGKDPTLWLTVHVHPPPFLVDVLQACYSSHYLFPLILGIELWLTKRFYELESYRMIMVYGAIFSFVGNMLVPAIGPRITLHEFAKLQTELPGIWVTNALRTMINTGEGLRATMTSAEAMRTVYRDAFPSGHTMFTVMTILVAFRYKVRVRWIIAILGTVLICATMILHYHYVIDVLAGMLCAVFVVWSAPVVARTLGSLKLWKGRDTATRHVRLKPTSFSTRSTPNSTSPTHK
jgi:membrane-associated phospholipid phosphatase